MSDLLSKLILCILYWFGGFIGALLCSVGLAFLLCALVALFNIFRFKWTWVALVVYLFLSLLCWWGVQLIFYGAGWLGDRTHYRMQFMLVVGAIVPGLGSLAVIPGFIKIAFKQTRGQIFD